MFWIHSKTPSFFPYAPHWQKFHYSKNTASFITNLELPFKFERLRLNIYLIDPRVFIVLHNLLSPYKECSICDNKRQYHSDLQTSVEQIQIPLQMGADLL